MATVITAGYKGQPHAHLTGLPGQRGKPAQTPVPGRVRIQHATPPTTVALWAELHRRALASDGADDTEWLARFRMRLPCGDCRKHWDGMLAASPPDWPAYFAWTVARHNEVNTRLQKPFMGLAQAQQLWSKKP